jgi:hypothetical protein
MKKLKNPMAKYIIIYLPGRIIHSLNVYIVADRQFAGQIHPYKKHPI